MEIDEGGSNFPKDVFDPKMHRNNTENNYLVSLNDYFRKEMGNKFDGLENIGEIVLERVKNYIESYEISLFLVWSELYFITFYVP